MGLISVYHTWTDGYIPMGLINAERLNANFSRLYTLVNGNLDEANIENPCLILIGNRDYTAEGYTISGDWAHSGDIAFSGDIECSSNLTISGTLNSIWALPAADGIANSVLKTDGAGNLSFTTFALPEACLWDSETDGISTTLNVSTDSQYVQIKGTPAGSIICGLSFADKKWIMEIFDEGIVGGYQAHGWMLVVGQQPAPGIPYITAHGNGAVADTRLEFVSSYFSDYLVKSGPGTITNSTDSGIAGEIEWDANYIYICIDTDTWKRVALSTW